MLIILEKSEWRLRAAVDTNKLFGTLPTDWIGKRAIVTEKTIMLCDFLTQWHLAKNKSVIPVPDWLVYVHYDSISAPIKT